LAMMSVSDCFAVPDADDPPPDPQAASRTAEARVAARPTDRSGWATLGLLDRRPRRRPLDGGEADDMAYSLWWAFGSETGRIGDGPLGWIAS
jgi:hypothetical protein